MRIKPPFIGRSTGKSVADVDPPIPAAAFDYQIRSKQITGMSGTPHGKRVNIDAIFEIWARQRSSNIRLLPEPIESLAETYAT